MITTARYIWVGICLSLALFFSQSWKMAGGFSPIKLQPSKDIIFVSLGLISFFYGKFFFNKYLELKERNFLKKATEKEKTNLVLLSFTIQFLIFETVGILGIILSLFTINAVKSIPFVLLSYFGLWQAFPKKNKIPAFIYEKTQNYETSKN